MSDISVGSVAVDIVPDTRGFAAKIKAQVSDLSAKVRLEAETSGFEGEVDAERTKQEKDPVKVPVKPQKLDEFAAKIRAEAQSVSKAATVDIPLTAEGERLRRDVAAQVELINNLVKVEIPVDLEDAAAVRAKMAVELDVLRAMARSANPTVNVDADTGAAQAKIAALAVESKVAGSGISGMLAGLVLLGPALVPVIAAVAGLGLALGAPIAAAAGGATVFGLIAGKEIANTLKVAKQIDQLRQKANTLVDPKAAASALAQANALEASLTGPQRAFLKAKDALGGAFSTLTKQAGGAIFRPIIQGMQLLGTIMPQLAPIIRSVSGALSGMLKSIGQSAKSGALKDFLGFLGQMSGPTLTGVGVILGNLAVGFGGLLKAFAPTAGQLTSGILGLSGAFADFGRNAGSNKGLQSFIAYVQQVGPMVASTLGSLVRAVVHLGAALAPLGVIVIGSIKVLADVISAVPTPVLTVLASVIGTVVLALKAWAIIQGVLDALLAANPIGLVVIAVAGLVVGLIAAYKSSQTFRDIVNGAFRAVGVAIDFVKEHWKIFLTVFLAGFGPIGIAIALLITHFNAVKSVAQTVFRAIIDAFLTVVGALITGAAKAFGWVPGIGGKLKAAAAEFDNFRDRVNAALDGIHSEKDIHINVVSTKQSIALSSINKPRVPHGATGGIVTRPTLAVIGEAGPEAVVPLNRTAGSSPLPHSSVESEQTYYRAFSRALANSGVVIMSKDNLDALDLLVGTA